MSTAFDSEAAYEAAQEQADEIAKEEADEIAKEAADEGLGVVGPASQVVPDELIERYWWVPIRNIRDG